MSTVYRNDVALNDSSKDFTFPGPRHIQQIAVKLVSTATVGNRRIVARVLNPAATVVAQIAAGATQAASLTHNYMFSPGLPRETAVVDNSLMVPLPMPGLYVPAGHTLRVLDSAAIDAAADDMDVHIVDVDPR